MEWRERTAAAADRPVQSILGDAALVELAKRKPSSSSQLEQIRGLGAASCTAAPASCWTPCGAGASARPSRCAKNHAHLRRTPTTGP